MHLVGRVWLSAVIVVITGLLAPSLVSAAEPDLARAKDAYDRGVRAHQMGDEGAAAKAFAEADALAPTVASLEAALEAAMRADDVALGAELLERADARPERDASLSKSIENARKRFANRAGTIRVDCRQLKCLLSVDGRPSDGSKPVFAAVGTHTVVVQRGEERVEKLVEVKANQQTVVGMEPMSAAVVAPTPTSPPQNTVVRTEPLNPPSPRGGISPAWFFVGVGLTAVAGGFATWSGLSAVSDHDAFVARGCAPGATGSKPSDCDSLSDAGSSATLRTNLLIAATALLAINTAVLGAFFVRWSPAPAMSGGTLSVTWSSTGGRL